MVTRLLIVLLMIIGAGGAHGELYVVRPALSNTPIFADEPLPAHVRAESTLRMAACRGEYESASILIDTGQDTWRSVRVTVTGLEEVADVDVMYVQALAQGVCWAKEVFPTALVRDLGMIEVVDEPPAWVLEREQTPVGPPGNLRPAADYVAAQSGVNRLLKPLIDAPTLVPADITGRQQYWITVRVADDAPAGVYAGSVVVEADNMPTQTLRLRLRVYPFDLAPSPFEHSLYYPVWLEGTFPEGHALQRGERSPERMLADFRDMVAHGANPLHYNTLGLHEDGSLDTTTIDRVLDLREAAGMPKGMLWLPDGPVHISDQEPTPEALADNARWTREINEWARARGYEGVGVMGCDEWSGERLRATRPWMESIRDAGGTVYVACYQDFWAQVGEALSVPVVQHPSAIANDTEQWTRTTREYLLDPTRRSGWDIRGWLQPEYQALVRNVHEAGNRMFTYMDPWGGQPLPEDHRRCRGVGLYVGNLDGTMTWAYTGFAAPIVRYGDPTVAANGVSPGGHGFVMVGEEAPIGSLQWEGYREGRDDARYIATLAAIDGGEWFESLSPDYLARVDLDRLRERVARRIIAERGRR